MKYCPVGKEKNHAEQDPNQNRDKKPEFLIVPSVLN